MRFFGGPADNKEVNVPDGHHVFRIETNHTGEVLYTLYRIRRWEREDGSLVDIMVTGDVSDDRIRKAMF